MRSRWNRLFALDDVIVSSSLSIGLKVEREKRFGERLGAK